MRIGVSTNVYRTVSNGFNVTTGWSLGAAGGALTSFPYYPVYDDEGEYYNLSTWDNPLFQAEGQENNSLVTNLFGKVYYAWEIVKGLTLQADFSGDFTDYQNNQFVTADLFGATATRALARGQITDRLTDRWIGTLMATYETHLAENHALKVMVGAEQQVINNTGNSMFSEEITRESFLWYNMAAFTQANHSISSYTSGSVFKSLFGRIDYNFLNRYIVEVTVRRDGSSKFGPEEKWGTFPSASAAWKLSEEEFIKNLGIFDQLRLRVSWGISGNDNISLYQWLPTMAVGSMRTGNVFGAVGSSGGDAPFVGAAIGRIPNESVHWEESATTDIGLDMGFFRNRLRFVVDLYNRTTSELLWNFPLPLYTGYGDGWNTGAGVTIVSNVAEMNNKGIELGLGADILVTGNFKWSVNFNISKNINEVISLAEETEFYAGITKVEPGEPIGNIWGFITDGIFQQGDDIENTPRFTGDEGLGDQRYLDANSNGILNDQDRGVIGNALPNFIYGLSTTLSYKGIELNAILNGVQGVDMYNGSMQTLSNGTIGEYNGGAWLWDSWTQENPDTDIPKMSDSYVDKTSDRFVEDASFLRLSNVQLSYSLPASVLSYVRMKHLRVYVSLQNYLTLTSYSGYDPEMHSGGNSNLNIGFDSQNYPSPKSITFGVQLGF
jgi:TonB-linked SusC/RagA family outer membrane protein